MPETFRFVTRLRTPLEEELRQVYAYTNPNRFKGMSDDELAKHITRVRDEAYKLAPWPCLGGFMFLQSAIKRAGVPSTYDSIVEHLKAKPQAKVLDLGCCFGYDARQLIKDGVRPDQVLSADLLPKLIDLGFELFGDEKDKGHLEGARWEKVDIFNQEDVERIRQPGGYDVIHTGMFLHLFPLRLQRQALATINSLLSKEAGSMVCGRQVGVPLGKAGTTKSTLDANNMGPRGLGAEEDNDWDQVFVHDPATLAKLFDEEDPGRWKVDTCEERMGDVEGDGEEMLPPGVFRDVELIAFNFTRL